MWVHSPSSRREAIHHAFGFAHHPIEQFLHRRNIVREAHTLAAGDNARIEIPFVVHHLRLRTPHDVEDFHWICVLGLQFRTFLGRRIRLHPVCGVEGAHYQHGVHL